MKCNVGRGVFDSVASDAGVGGVRATSRPAGESVQVLKARFIQRAHNNREVWEAVAEMSGIE